MKRYIKILLLYSGIIFSTFIVFFIPACNNKVSAKVNTSSAYNVEQAQGNAPVIKAYINGKNMTNKTNIQAKVTGADFSNDMGFELESLKKFSVADEGIHYIILLDNSMSVDEGQFKQAKEELVKLVKNMSGSDIMDLYTVGSDSSNGKKKYITGSKKADKKKQAEAIKSIKRNKGKTVLYRSLSEILGTSDNGSMRTIVLLITDGEDDSQGKNNKLYQVNPVVKQSKIPIYGILCKNTSGNPDKDKIKNTKKNILNEKASHGYYEECMSLKDVKKGFQNIQDILYKETYIAILRQENGSNRITTDASLVLICNNEEIKLSKGKFTYNHIGEADTEPPVIGDISKTGSNSIEFTIRDDKTDYINGAGQAGNYTVKDEDGRDWKVDKVNMDKEAGTYELIFKEDLYTGSYTIKCSNITDDAQEKNPISEAAVFSFDGLNGTTEYIKKLINKYWWMGLILIVIIIGCVLALILKYKADRKEDIDMEELNKAGSKLLSVTVTDINGITREAEWNIDGSIFVGSSSICDIYFDDGMLSKQHFAVEVTKAGCYVEDLDTDNGTFVNGVRMTGKRRISEGDVIKAGSETFIFHNILGSEVK